MQKVEVDVYRFLSCSYYFSFWLILPLKSFCFLFSFSASLMLTSRRKRRSPFSLSLIQVLHLSPPLSVELFYWVTFLTAGWRLQVPHVGEGFVFLTFSQWRLKTKRLIFHSSSQQGILFWLLVHSGATPICPAQVPSSTHTGPHPFTPRRWKTGSETEHNRHQGPFKVHWAPCFSIKNV